ncbi:uncharacterized protein LOC122199835 isoform X2 [Panthera leo]|uniref:uncharacterized protein LOC122199835 isoform X2 n=1 Tax=Panthera leo TaxID=9689 RepID=UPI001C69C1F3|nr:uncharacterized protein LOC122199835 isoform X2 [Panthera leo]XP_042761122.1 uncharacterized protein LOC122199835 isoform X2 [Panthera leo]XP_042761123.1 uncharacterized protein LOC122199835 isoform X2 [Panthera leo]
MLTSAGVWIPVLSLGPAMHQDPKPVSQPISPCHDDLRAWMELIHCTCWEQTQLGLGCEYPDQRPTTGKVTAPAATHRLPFWAQLGEDLPEEGGMIGVERATNESPYVTVDLHIPLRAHHCLPQSPLTLMPTFGTYSYFLLGPRLETLHFLQPPSLCLLCIRFLPTKDKTEDSKQNTSFCLFSPLFPKPYSYLVKLPFLTQRKEGTNFFYPGQGEERKGKEVEIHLVDYITSLSLASCFP